MKYMLMIYNNADVWNSLSREEHEAVWSEGGKLWQDLVASGEGIMGEPLAAPRDAHIVRVQNGVPLITDGPFAEAKEQFVGFLMVDVASEERALEIAASWPDAKYAPIEVRFIRDDNAKATAEAVAATTTGAR